jgi:hypothetical protein
MTTLMRATALLLLWLCLVLSGCGTWAFACMTAKQDAGGTSWLCNL